MDQVACMDHEWNACGCDLMVNRTTDHHRQSAAAGVAPLHLSPPTPRVRRVRSCMIPMGSDHDNEEGNVRQSPPIGCRHQRRSSRRPRQFPTPTPPHVAGAVSSPRHRSSSPVVKIAMRHRPRSSSSSAASALLIPSAGPTASGRSIDINGDSLHSSCLVEAATPAPPQPSKAWASRWTQKRKQRRRILMARYFASWFLATLAAGHLYLASQNHLPAVSVVTGGSPNGRKKPRFRISSLLAPFHASSKYWLQQQDEKKWGSCTVNRTRVYLPAPLPNLIIAGAQKSGTTALASILSQHPQIQAHGVSPEEIGGLETHFFDHLYPSLLEESASVSPSPRDRRCWLRYRYASFYRDQIQNMHRRRRSSRQWLHLTSPSSTTTFATRTQENEPVRIRLEKSPSYLISPHVPDAVRQVLGPSDDDKDDAKKLGRTELNDPESTGTTSPSLFVLVLLRDPVERLLSHYRMMTKRRQTTVRSATPTSQSTNRTPSSIEVDRNQELIDLLNRELFLLRNPVRTYLASVFDPAHDGNLTNDNTSSKDRRWFDLPPSPPLGSDQYYSHYWWDDLARTPSSFRGFDRLLQRGMYSVQLERWMHALGAKDRGNGSLGSSRILPHDRIHLNHGSLIIIPFELFESHPRQVLDYVWKRLGVSSWTVPSSVLEKRYDPDGSWTARDDHEDVNGSDDEEASDDATSPVVINFLSEFYRPYNERLADLIGEEWRGIWDEANSPYGDDGAAWKQIWLQKLRHYPKAVVGPRKGL